MVRRLLVSLMPVVVLLAIPVSGSAAGGSGADRLARINHIVVIYEENHSFDNLYGSWEGVNGRANADAAHTIQLNQAGAPFECLLQTDVNLTSPPLPVTCNDPANGISSDFTNAPFQIDTFIPPEWRTCPQPGQFAPNGLRPDPKNLPGGCTRDIVHRFYQEQYQLDAGRQDHYTTGSDAVGLTQGYYDTSALPIYTYLHGDGHPHFAIADDFFQAAFGGSFLNHQWLIAAASPTWLGAPPNLHSVVDSNGMPNKYPLYTPTGPVSDQPLTQACPSAVPGLACGDYAVNTIQPTYQPTSSNPVKLPPQTGTTIGDELSASGVSWAWYSGGWSNADGDVGAPGWTNGNGPDCSDPDSTPNPAFPYCPNKVFQFHHQRSTTTRTTRPGRRGGRTCATRPSSSSSPRLRGPLASSTRSASSSPPDWRTSIPGTRARYGGAATSSSCCRPSRQAAAARTRWWSSLTTSSVASGITSLLRARAGRRGRTTSGAPAHGYRRC